LKYKKLSFQDLAPNVQMCTPAITVATKGGIANYQFVERRREIRMNSAVRALIGCCVVAVLAGACGSGGNSDTGSSGGNERTFQPLEFPFSNPSDIVRLASFGIPNWSGTDPHNGIDLIVSQSLESSQIISPTAGVITRIETSENPFSHPIGQLLMTIGIRVNDEWEVNLVIEPGCNDEVTKAAQLAAVQVSVGQEVVVGTPVVSLLIGPLGYAHLHFMPFRNGEAFCAYAHSSDTARLIFEAIALKDASGLPDGNICYGAP
jgi:murein DD-endopeptidase MepM/ murein hydrolase activator NlpD